jgi:SAM-dependent methyltransferase
MTFEEKIKERYSGEKGKNYHGSKRSIPESAYSWVAKLRAEKIAPYIKQTDTIFEYGVGTGWNLAELNCQTRLGYDLSEHLEPTLKSHDIEYIKDLSIIENASINIVVCHHVLEHVSNPPEVFKEIRRILCDDGKLLLYVPYEKERRYRQYNPNEPNHHIYSWNVQTLGNLVCDMGFKFIHGEIQEFGYDRFAAVWAVKLGLRESGFRLIRKAIHLIKPASEVCIIAEKEY